MRPVTLDGAYVIEPLSRRHERKAFACGRDALDRYLQEQALQEGRRHVAATFVAVPHGSRVVSGYYSLSATSIDAGDLPHALARRLPRYPKLPATLLARLAVDSRHQRRRLGEYLLIHALFRSLMHSAEVASMAVLVDAMDDSAIAFYQAYGFLTLPDKPRCLYLPTASIVRHFG